MFPNPQDSLPLPARPNLEHYRKLAKALVRAGKASTLRADDRLEEFAQRKFAGKFTLTGAQFVIARSYGFLSWPKFTKHLEGLAKKSTVSRFEAAADAIVDGDITKLKRLLKEDPKLIRARSTREHGAMLLHYAAANGVEGYRQKTPQNIVEIANMLLEAGAEIDALADVYGGGCTTLGLAATSVHPEKAGVQEALLQILLDHGASVELQSAGNGHSLLTACLANGRPKAGRYLADRGAPVNLVEAAGIGRLDVVRGMAGDATAEQINNALLYACVYGHNEIVELLIDQGADLAAHQGDGQTPLHMAAIGGRLETVKLLLRHGPPLELENVYGGTVLGQALWSAAHGGNTDTFIAILEELVAGGAKIPARHVPVNARVDAWLARRGSAAEPRWYWFGEKPAG